ncbi:unnamed protein product [Brachionus calyciflorus]|uniref:EF-hand domain-containing protein n=1 Tax=Brachionus calyciflorus TaxID=104777 RepID=A0A814F7Y7_9BILA|nr:unnamed protein product [Brachionus calyciflorus]
MNLIEFDFPDDYNIKSNISISGHKIALTIPKFSKQQQQQQNKNHQRRLIHHFKFENLIKIQEHKNEYKLNYNQMSSNEEKFPDIQMKYENKISPRAKLKPETFKLPLYNGNSNIKENEIRESIKKYKKLEPISKYGDSYKSDDNLNIRSKLIKFSSMDKKLERFKHELSSSPTQDIDLLAPSYDDQYDTFTQSQSAINSNTSRSSLKQPEISRAKLKSKTPIYYSPDENLRNLKTPVHIAVGRWSPIKIRSNKNLKLHERFKIHSEYKMIFNKLDEDKDGHLNFDALKFEFCRNMDQSQISFFYQIYDYLSEATYFGLQEFSTFYQMAEEFKRLDYKSTGYYWDIFISSDFEDYRKEIKEYINLIDHLDFYRQVCIEDVMKLKIKNLDRGLFLSQQSKMRMEVNKINQILDQRILGGDNDDNIETKIVNYVLYIPIYIYLESFFKNKQIFQRKNNSILDSKESTNYHTFSKRTW